MKRIGQIVEKLNELVILNEEVENAYKKASSKLENNYTKTYAKEKSLERGEFVRFLKIELTKLEANDENLIALKRKFHMVRLNFRKFIKIENDAEFLGKVYEIEVLSINKYDDLLSQINLPLTLCKLLLKQRDFLQARLHVMERGELVVSSS
ncbi:DUF2383 domain-containing protein [Seonamhaeicola maritimus]|uniref:DUF2383 domain-containing protein n=1 Tax=Seonamhaeicola maritimus TaxID=2591822 RepID=UPI0024952716|nr:DUF2383 domain-containing protein [Seonamhaeicola maritimus]